MTAGDKSNLDPVFLDALASAGYAVVSVNYRLAPQFKFPRRTSLRRTRRPSF
jgi:acetyl esterase/lipase